MKKILLLAQDMFCKHKWYGKQRNKTELSGQRKKH